MIKMIVAFDENQVIGKDNQLIWHFKEDLKYFKEQTLHQKVLFGKNTFFSIYNINNCLLPNRETLVLTTDQNFSFPGVKVYHSKEEVLEAFKDEDLIIAGGAKVYETFLDVADYLYITHIAKAYSGDAYFPKFNYEDYDLISTKEEGILTFNVYKRKCR